MWLSRQGVGLIIQGSWVVLPVMPTVSYGITSLGKMLTWSVLLSTQEYWVPGFLVCAVLWQHPSMFPEGTETDNLCEKVLKPRPWCKCKVQ